MPTLSPVIVREASLVNFALSCAASTDSTSISPVVPGKEAYLSTYFSVAVTIPSERPSCLPGPAKGSASGTVNESKAACASGLKFLVVTASSVVGKSSVTTASCSAFFLAFKASSAACASGDSAM